MNEHSTSGRYLISLSGKQANGQAVEVSPEDYDWAKARSWFIVGKYPSAKIDRKMRALHRVIMGEPIGLEVDHIDGNKLNARRDNLRVCSRQENARNRKPQSGFKGVTFVPRCVARGWKPWRACIQHQGKEVYLGYFFEEHEAAEAYNTAALELFGEFARLNDI